MSKGGRGAKPMVRGSIDWDAQPLGQMSDMALARQLGVSEKPVRNARIARGIPAYRKGVFPYVDWDRQPLGKYPDAVLAERLGVSHSAVHLARNRRRIPPARPELGRRDIDWRAWPVGKVPDALIAWLVRITELRVKQRRFEAGRRPPEVLTCPCCERGLWLRVRDDVLFVDRLPGSKRGRPH